MGSTGGNSPLCPPAAGFAFELDRHGAGARVLLTVDNSLDAN